MSFETDIASLRGAFNGDSELVRLVLLLSPTCEECLRGASEVDRLVLRRIQSDELSVLAVWLPMLEGDDEFAVRDASGSYLLDPRVSHFWDAEGDLKWRYAELLDLPEEQPAWDIYMVFQQGTIWQEEPPRPDFWMHQLDIDEAPFLEPLRLAREIEKLLE